MSLAPAAPRLTKAQRAERFRAADWAGRLAFHEEAAALKREALAARRALGRLYLERCPPAILIPHDKALTIANLAAETRALRQEAAALAFGRETSVNNIALEFPVLAKDFGPGSAAVAFGLSPLIVAPLTRYFGMLPVLFNMFVTRAHNTEIRPNSAHLAHLDPEDVISFKVFVHLTDVDAECGPFHAVPADLTQSVLARIDYRNIDRLTDAQLEALVGFDRVVQAVGPAGTVVFADTTRCLHFGGRPRAPGKPVREMVVYQYLLPTSFLFDEDGAHPRFIPQLQATGDEVWDALIGARFT